MYNIYIYCFQDWSRRLNTTNCGQLPQRNRAWQGLNRLLGVHDEGTIVLAYVYRDKSYCFEGESSTGARARFQIGVLLGGEENLTKKQMQDVINFETRLAEITIPPEDRRDEEKMYNLMTLNDLQKNAPFVRLTSFIPHHIFQLRNITTVGYNQCDFPSIWCYLLL